MSSSRSSRKVKSEVDYDEVDSEVDDDDFKAPEQEVESNSEESEPAKKKEKSKGESNKGEISKGKKRPPPTYETFENKTGVTLHLVVKDAEGKELKQVPLKKHQYGTGSYGWTLSDKIVVDDGMGGSLTIGLHSNCVVQGSKSKKARV